MNPERVKATLRETRKIYRHILDENSKSIVLPAAEASVDESYAAYIEAKKNATRGAKVKPWGYSIEHDQPIRFIRSPENGVQLRADIYCDIKWAEDDSLVTQDIKLRVWSEHIPTIYTPERDAEAIEDAVTDPERSHPGRVVLRMHFDRANPDQLGPEHHLQIGGKPEEYELCWHPESVKVPRLSFQPMELFLACQIVAANFFPTEYADLSLKSEWIQELIYYQNALLLGYYKRCMDAINSHISLLDALQRA